MSSTSHLSAKVLMHELQVHQVELEMQNEELRRIQLDLSTARDRFVDLYDFAPVGYFTLNAQGLVIEANLTGAAMLGEPRKTLIGTLFARFVATPDRVRWQSDLAPAAWRDDSWRFEFTVQPRRGALFHGQLDCLQVAAVGAEPVLRMVLTDISPRKQAELNRRIADTVVQASETERRQVARQLHDELGQRLSALKMELGSLTSMAASPAQAQRVGAMLGLLDESVATVRQIAMDLRPLMLDDLGLSESIDWLVRDSARRLGLSISLTLADDLPSLSEPTTTALYRLVQEALSQIAGRGRGGEVAIDLRRKGKELVLTMRHDHGGWPMAAQPLKSAGTLALHERAHLLNARLERTDEPGGAQQIMICVPLVNVASAPILRSSI
jgi:PAS domain S-box-containing protein